MKKEISMFYVSQKHGFFHTSLTLLLTYLIIRFLDDKRRGAGACIYVRNKLKANLINLDIISPPALEDVWLTVQCRKLPAIIIGSMYRHPKALSASFDYIEDVFRRVNIRNFVLFIFGDFNDGLTADNNKLSRIIMNNKLTKIIDIPNKQELLLHQQHYWT